MTLVDVAQELRRFYKPMWKPKPHIQRTSGVWMCSDRARESLGFGFTPLGAYRDWQRKGER